MFSPHLRNELHNALDLQRQGRLDACLNQLSAIAEHHPALIGIAVARLQSLRSLGRANEADATLAALQQRHPGSFEVSLVLADARRRAGHFTEAAALCRGVLEQVPDHLGARIALDALPPGSLEASSDPLGQLDPLDALIEAGERAYANNLFKAALDQFRQAAAIAPDHLDLQVAMARCFRQLWDLEAAAALLHGALERDGSLFSAILGMAELHAWKGEHEQAVPWYRRAHEAQPANPALFAALIGTLRQAQRHGEASELMAAQLEKHPGDSGLLAAKVELDSASGRDAEALAASMQLMGLPEPTMAQQLLHASLLQRNGQGEEALAWLESLPSNGDKTCEARLWQARGQLHWEAGRLTEAVEALLQAVNSNPTEPEHAVVLGNLLADLAALEEGLDVLANSERLIALEQGLRTQPWIQFIKVRFFRAAGEMEAALAIAEGLCNDPGVGFAARLQRFELLCLSADERAELALEGLDPIEPAQKRLALFARCDWLSSHYRFDEALKTLLPLLEAESLDLVAAERACLLQTLVMDIEAAQDLFFQLRRAKQSSGNPRLAETAWHGLHRCLIEEFHTNQFALARIRALAAELPDQRLRRLATLLAEEPSCSAAALSLLIAARQAGRLSSWSTAPVAADGGERIPHRVFQYWDTTTVPNGVRSLMQSWPQANPSFEHQVLDRAAAAAFLAEHTPPLVQKAFAAAISPVLQSHLFRYAWLLHHGGLYADADTRCRQSLSNLMNQGVNLLLHQEEHGAIGNTLIAAVPGHPFLAEVLETAARLVLEEQASNPWFLSGCGVLTQVFTRHYGHLIADPQALQPAGMRLLTSYQLSRHVSLHLKAPVRVSEAGWSSPLGAEKAAKRLVQVRRSG